MIANELINEINSAYHELELKHAEIVHALSHRMFELKSGWYNGHYSRTPDGSWHYDSYPIPVIDIKGLCDIEISFTKLSVSTKLKRAKALDYSYEKLKPYRFEAYGVENYLCDFLKEDQTIDELKQNIKQSGEKEIGFSFLFPHETDGKKLFGFAKLLQREGFYY